MKKPIILLGAGRSGTKFLRSVLASSSEVAQIPYDVGYVWRYGNEDLAHDELNLGMLSEKTKSYVRRTLPSIVDGYFDSNIKYFIEKSVPNTLRPEYVFSIFPEAKFIHLIRDGRAVTESAMRMWTKPPERLYLFKKLRYFPWSNYKYAWWYVANIVKGKITGSRGQHTWGPRYAGMDEDVESLPLVTVCARQWKKCVQTCCFQLKNIPSSQVMEVRYEDLMHDESTLKMLCDFIGIGDTEAVMSYFRSNIVDNNNESWKKKLSDEELLNINSEIINLLQDLGYGEDDGK